MGNKMRTKTKQAEEAQEKQPDSAVEGKASWRR